METNETLPLDESKDPSPYLKQIDMPRVMDLRGCGDHNCHTIRFERTGSGITPALVTYHTEDGRS